MRRKLIWGAAVAALLLGLLPAMAGDKSEPSQQKFNLADLANGESRTFGEGDQAITATRYGDDIEVTYQGKKGENKKQTLHCTVGKDTCYAMTLTDEGKGHVVMLSQTATSGQKGQLKEVKKIVLTGGDTDGKSLMVFAGDGECCAGTGAMVVGDGSGMSWVTATSDSEPGVQVMELHEEGTTLLKCPKGDATLILHKGEENSGPYFCPKHNLQMEVVKAPVILKKIEVHKKTDTGTKSQDDGEF